jgi:hypothetical protein
VMMLHFSSKRHVQHYDFGSNSRVLSNPRRHSLLLQQRQQIL